MLSTILRYLLRPAGLMALGLALMLFGGSLRLGDPATMPEQTSLQQMTGVLEGASKVTTRRRSRGASVSYELRIKDADGVVATFLLPEGEIEESQVEALFGAPLSVLYASYGNDRDIWELATGSHTIIDYAGAMAKRGRGLATKASVGRFIIGGGVVVLFCGLTWWRRRGEL